MDPEEIMDRLAYIKTIWERLFTDESEAKNIEALDAAIEMIEKS